MRKVRWSALFDSNKMLKKPINYYYLRIGQGDIVGILDQSGTKVVSYSYDSCGTQSSTEGRWRVYGERIIR